MGINTAISWCDHSWNPWTGCIKVSPGCKFCYMYRDKERYGLDPTTVIRSTDATFYAPLRKKAFQAPSRVFTCSWSDFFIEQADAWRSDAWKVIRETPHLTYQILTKRPERIKQCLPDDWNAGYPNVWLGVSAENQQLADERIPVLLDVPANVYFLSLEPLLGPIDLAEYLPGDAWFNSEYGMLSPVDWVIIGGESGNTTGKYHYRPTELNWIKQIIWQCDQSDTPVFIKQTGTYLAKQMQLNNRHGTDIAEWPLDLQRQEIPVFSTMPHQRISKQFTQVFNEKYYPFE